MRAPRPRFEHRRDKNEGAIVAVLRLHGWLVLQLDSTTGIPDLLCVRGERRELLEVKMPEGTLTPKQVETHAALRAAGYAVPIVTTPGEALAALKGGPVRTALDVPARKPKGQRKARVALLARLSRTSLLETAARAAGPSRLPTSERPTRPQQQDLRALATPNLRRGR